MEKEIRCRDGSTVFYKHFPSRSEKPYLIFIHGLSGNSTIWTHTTNQFMKKGYPIIAVDLRGHGKSHSNGKIGQYMIETFTSDMKEIIDKEGVRDFYLIGYSLGGMVSLLFDKLYQNRPKGIVIISTAHSNPLKYNCIPFLQLTTPLFKLAIKAGGHIAKHIHRKSYPYIDYCNLKNYNAVTILSKDLLGTPLYAYWWTLYSILEFDIRDHLPKMKTPVLCIAGKRDYNVSWRALKEISDSVDNGRLVVLDRADHLNPIKMPEELNKLIEGFI